VFLFKLLQFGTKLPIFWRNLLPHRKFRDEVTKFYQNISTHEPNY